MSGPAPPGAATDPDPQDPPDFPVQPSERLLHLIIACLAPLFMAGTNDPRLARLSAIEAFTSYQAQTQAELLIIAQIIAFGLAAMDTLRLAMMPDLSLSMKLRLRSCANGLNRSAQQNVRTLEKLRRDNPSPEPRAAALAAMSADPAAEDETNAADVKAAVAQADAIVKDACARMQAALHAAQDQPASAPSVPVDPAQSHAGPAPPASIRSVRIPSDPDRTTAIHHDPRTAKAPTQPFFLSRQQRANLMWANAMTDVAAELAGGIGTQVPPNMSKSDLMWADTLSSVARQLATGDDGMPEPADAAHPMITNPPKRR